MDVPLKLQDDYTRLSTGQIGEKVYGWFRTSLFTEFYEDAVEIVSQVIAKRTGDDKLVLLLDFSKRYFALYLMSDYLEIKTAYIPGRRAKELWRNDIRRLIEVFGYIPNPLHDSKELEKRKVPVSNWNPFRYLTDLLKWFIYRRNIVAYAKRNNDEKESKRAAV